jgi:hypothetical protein
VAHYNAECTFAVENTAANEGKTMPSKIALTEQQKARMFDKLIERDVIRWRVGPRLVDGEMVQRTYVEHGETKDILVIEE